MAFNVTLQPSGLHFEADAKSTLLDAAENAGVAMPYGCRGGSCGACKGRVISGNLERGIEDRFALTEPERADGYMLLCVARPQSDVVIEVADAGRIGDIVIKKIPVRIAAIERAAPDVIVVTFKLPATESFNFRAGQYVALQFKDGERRDFSIANAPDERHHLQFHIRLSEGSYSTRMFTEVLKEKDILRIEGPLGNFHLNPTSGKPMIMVAAGTGFAPIKAILDDMAHRNIQREVHLYRGSRDRVGLYLQNLPCQWHTTIRDFTYVPVLSDPTPACRWDGRRGLVHEAVLEDFTDLSQYEVYACGAVAMVEATRRDFATRGLPADAFFADAFTPAPTK